MVGHWPRAFLRVFGPKRGRRPQTCKKATQNQERAVNPEGTNKLITNLPQLIDSHFFTRRFAEYNLDTRSVNSPWLKPNANEGFF